MSELNQEEKIDYIYNYIKSEKRNKVLKVIFRILVIIIIYFWVIHLINNVGEEQIKKTVSDQIWDITEPIIRNMVWDLENWSVSWIDRDKIQKILKENPSLLDNFK